MKEIWKDVVDYEGLYSVSDTGKVYSHSSGRIISTKTNNRDYVQVHLYKDGICKMKLLHRLVAEAFVLNESNLPQVNHIDEDKSNNCVKNLEWCTNLYNRHRGTGIQRSTQNHDFIAIARKNSRPVLQFGLSGKILNKFHGVIEAQRQTGITESNIRRVCCGKGKTAGGYKWEYAS